LEFQITQDGRKKIRPWDSLVIVGITINRPISEKGTPGITGSWTTKSVRSHIDVGLADTGLSRNYQSTGLFVPRQLHDLSLVRFTLERILSSAFMKQEEPVRKEHARSADGISAVSC